MYWSSRAYAHTAHPYQQSVYPYAPSLYTPVGGYAYSAHAYSTFARTAPVPSIQDYGAQPLVINIEDAAKSNDTFRTALWTGQHFQVTVMSIGVGDDIGLEVHPATDQFVRIEQGNGVVQMGDSRDRLDYVANASEGYAVMVPAGKWHNITNTGPVPLKVYVIYAPPEHPFGTVHPTKADALAEEAGR